MGKARKLFRLITQNRLLDGDFNQRVEAYKRKLILDAFGQANGNQAEAARQLGLSYHQYRYFYGKYQNRDDGITG